MQSMDCDLPLVYSKWAPIRLTLCSLFYKQCHVQQARHSSSPTLQIELEQNMVPKPRTVKQQKLKPQYMSSELSDHKAMILYVVLN